jgi:hypothetical protein
VFVCDARQQPATANESGKWNCWAIVTANVDMVARARHRTTAPAATATPSHPRSAPSAKYPGVLGTPEVVNFITNNNSEHSYRQRRLVACRYAHHRVHCGLELLSSRFMWCMLNMRARTDQEHAERVCSAPNRTRGVVASPLALLQVVNELPELSHQPAVDVMSLCAFLLTCFSCATHMHWSHWTPHRLTHRPVH